MDAPSSGKDLKNQQTNIALVARVREYCFRGLSSRDHRQSCDMWILLHVRLSPSIISVVVMCMIGIPSRNSDSVYNKNNGVG